MKINYEKLKELETKEQMIEWLKPLCASRFSIGKSANADFEFSKGELSKKVNTSNESGTKKIKKTGINNKKWEIK
jgi:hypothetical protein